MNYLVKTLVTYRDGTQRNVSLLIKNKDFDWYPSRIAHSFLPSKDIAGYDTYDEEEITDEEASRLTKGKRGKRDNSGYTSYLISDTEDLSNTGFDESELLSLREAAKESTNETVRWSNG